MSDSMEFVDHGEIAFVTGIIAVIGQLWAELSLSPATAECAACSAGSGLDPATGNSDPTPDTRYAAVNRVLGSRR